MNNQREKHPVRWLLVALLAALVLAMPASASWGTSDGTTDSTDTELSTETSTQTGDYVSVEESEAIRQQEIAQAEQEKAEREQQKQAYQNQISDLQSDLDALKQEQAALQEKLDGVTDQRQQAEAVIAGDKVAVSSPEVSEPVAVRYAWSDNPAMANLYNAAGFPALPFRSDPEAE